MQTIRHAFIDVSLQRIVRGNTSGFVCFRLRRIADVRHAQIDVSTFISSQVGGTIRKVGWICVEVLKGSRSCLLNGIPVGIRLAVNRASGGCNVCLIKRNGDHLVAPDIADIADVHCHIVAWLPLDIEGVIDAIGEFVCPVVRRKGEERRSVGDVCRARKILADVCWIAAWLVSWGGAPGIGKCESPG